MNEEETVFQEARLIGRVLRKYQLGVSNLRFAYRIAVLIQNGTLEAVTRAKPEEPAS